MTAVLFLREHDKCIKMSENRLTVFLKSRGKVRARKGNANARAEKKTMSKTIRVWRGDAKRSECRTEHVHERHNNCSEM